MATQVVSEAGSGAVAGVTAGQVSGGMRPRQSAPVGRVTGEPRGVSRYAVLAGRILFGSMFLLAAPFHFTQPEIAMAVAAGVPAAKFLVPASGLLALAGGLSVVLGYRAKIGAWLLVLFLVPVTLAMHNFWAVQDATMAQMQLANFLKNVSILGGLLLISQFGAGPLSLDARRRWW
jgi:putative oxidoreductase